MNEKHTLNIFYSSIIIALMVFICFGLINLSYWASDLKTSILQTNSEVKAMHKEVKAMHKEVIEVLKKIETTLDKTSNLLEKK